MSAHIRSQKQPIRNPIEFVCVVKLSQKQSSSSVQSIPSCKIDKKMIYYVHDSADIIRDFDVASFQSTFG